MDNSAMNWQLLLEPFSIGFLTVIAVMWLFGSYLKRHTQELRRQKAARNQTGPRSDLTTAP